MLLVPGAHAPHRLGDSDHEVVQLPGDVVRLMQLGMLALHLNGPSSSVHNILI